METLTARQIVEQGLQARKETRAAEARAEKLREEATAANEARFYEQMKLQNAQRAWQYEREDLTGTISRQRTALRQLREEMGEMRKRERQARRRRILFSVVKAAIIFGLLICARSKELIVYWLADSLLAFTATYLFVAVIALTRKKQTPAAWPNHYIGGKTP